MSRKKPSDKKTVTHLLGQMRAHLDAMKWHETRVEQLKSKIEKLLPPETPLPTWASSTTKH